LIDNNDASEISQSSYSVRALVRRTDPTISPEFVAGMNRFARDVGISDGQAPYDRVVATRFSNLWK
jgi:hypothetical protein